MSRAALFGGEYDHTGQIRWRSSSPVISAVRRHLARPVTMVNHNYEHEHDAHEPGGSWAGLLANF